MSWLSKGYRKSGLRDIYEKNKKGLLTAAAIAAAAGTGGLAAPALGGTLGTGILLGGATGAALAQKKIEKDKQQKMLNAANKSKEEAANNLDTMLGDITGTNPSSKPAGVYGGPVGGDVAPVISPTGGIVGGTGEAAKDQNRLLSEAEYQKQLQTGDIGASKDARKLMLQEYADLVSQQQNRLLDENAPKLYEDLNTRGLLRSSELGNAMGRERAKAASILGEQVGLQGLQDREAYLKDLSGVNNQYYGGRYNAIQRGMSLEDFARQTKAAQLTGQALAPLPQAAPSSKGGQAAMIGAGANVATAMRGK